MKREGLFRLILLMTVATVFTIGFPLVAYPQIGLAVGEGTGLPGTSGNPVEVSLANPGDKVKGVSIDVCDVNNYLSCTGCETTGRVPYGFECVYNNMANGCVRAILINLANINMIEEGEGPIFSIEYDVSGLAPSGDCRGLNPEEVSVSDEHGDPFPSSYVTSEAGEFCFFNCVNDLDCDDGLYCNGAERCEGGVCWRGDYPCQTPPNLSCDEGTDQCIAGPGPVITTIGEGTGLPGSSGNLVEVSLINPGDKVKGVSMDICDLGNYLNCTGCETTGRAPSGFECMYYNMANGCVRVILVNLANLDMIEEGEGPVFNIEYEVSGLAPSGGCRDLNPEEVTVLSVDEMGDPFELDVAIESGKFCFFSCVNDLDCDDGLYCNGAERCVGGVCWQGTDPCPPGATCNEADDVCNCSQDADCDDGLYCSGAERCESGVCEAGTNPCTLPLMCDEDNDACVECLTGADCDDGIYCNGAERCEDGYCQPGIDPCTPPLVCNEADDVCNCSQDADCDDGLYCSGAERCEGGVCEEGDYPCINPPYLSCDEANDVCKPVTIIIGDGSGFRGSTDNPVDVSLEYISIDIKGVQMDVCDVDDYLICSGCNPGGCTPSGFECLYNNLTNGCVRVILVNLSNFNVIEGEGPIFTLKYDVSEGAPGGKCRDLSPEDVHVSDKYNAPLEVEVVGGEFCFLNCVNNLDCSDGLFCNGEEICVDGACQPGSDPCPDDGLYCTGVEGCDEDNDVCTQSGDPCAPDLMCDEDEDLCYEVIVDIEDSSGIRGSTDNSVEVSLDNPNDKVRTVQMDVCDVDYLTCTGCETTERTSGFSCIANEFYGCCRVVLVSFGSDFIESGTGSIFTIKYDVSEGAPGGGCRDLNPENVYISDEFDVSLEAKLVGGEFCFLNCVNDLDCDDGLYCNGEEICVDGACQPGSDPCPPDTLFCYEDEDICVGTCEIEIYKGGSCGEGEPLPYNRPGRRGVALTCGDTVQFCYCSTCDPNAIGQEDPCPVWSIYPEDTPAGTTITTNPDGTATLTIGTGCDTLDYPVDIEVTVADPCNYDISDTITVQVGKVVLEVLDTRTHPGSETAEVVVSLKNPNHKVKGIQVDIGNGDPGEEDHLTCTGCAPDPDRTPQFSCSVQEQSDGTCRVVLITTNSTAAIQEGEGPVLTIDYVVAPDAPSEECICLWPYNRMIADRFGDPLCSCGEAGQICFFMCGDVYPRECLPDQSSCGDGVVNVFDILEEIDYVLGIIELSDCQLIRADVPVGTPPFCADPDGKIDIFDALVINDMALGMANCCDYYYFNEIY